MQRNRAHRHATRGSNAPETQGAKKQRVEATWRTPKVQKATCGSNVCKAENLGFDLHILLYSWTMCSPPCFVPRRAQSFGSYSLCIRTLYSFLFACLVPRRARSTVIYFWFSAAVLSRKPLCNMKILFSNLSMGELRKVSSPHVVGKNDWTITVL